MPHDDMTSELAMAGLGKHKCGGECDKFRAELAETTETENTRAAAQASLILIMFWFFFQDSNLKHVQVAFWILN